MSRLEEIKKRLEDATPSPWVFRGNVPFYVEVVKPAPSLSKHDDKRPTYWRYEDGVFVAHAMDDICYLLEALQISLSALEDIQLLHSHESTKLTSTEMNAIAANAIDNIEDL